MRMSPRLLTLLMTFCAAAPALGRERLVTVDKDLREVRVACDALRVDVPLEFFCVVRGTSDHETVLRTKARPAEIHAALLGLGIEPGTPLRDVPGTNRFLPPSGPPIRVEAEWQRDGRTVRERAGRLIRDVKTHRPMDNRPFVFVGSKFLDDGQYAADVTGQIVSLVNFEYTVLDVPQVASNANETLEWEVDPDVAPPPGTAVTMILTVIGDGAGPAAATRPATASASEIPPKIVEITVSKGGEIEVDHEAIEPTDLAAAVRRRAGGDSDPAVRLTAPVGAPVQAVGQLFARLAAAKLTDVRFVPPPDEVTASRPNAFGPPPITVSVMNGGRDVLVAGARTVELSPFLPDGNIPLDRFVYELKRDAAKPEMLGRDFIVEPFNFRGAANDAPAIDLAAPAAALHVLGYRNVRVQMPAASDQDTPAPPTTTPPPTTRPDEGAGARLAELRRAWEQRVLPQGAALRRAAQTHYEVMQAYQDEINKKLDEVETLRREMDALQQRYNELTTPQPIPATGPSAE